MASVAVLSLVAIVGCGKKAQNQAADAVTEVAGAAPTAAPIATNEDTVSRFPDEKPLDIVVATLQRTANVREIPTVGKVVASLAKGTTVSQIAQHRTASLVVFESPQDHKKLMGWVGQDAFTSAPNVAAPKVLTCTAPEVPLLSDTPFCARVCTSDSGCRAGEACRGAANTFTKGKVGDPVALCTVFTPPPPRPVTPVAVAPRSSPVVAAGNAPAAPAPPPAPPRPTTAAAPAAAPQPAPGLPASGRPNGMPCTINGHCDSIRCVGDSAATAVCTSCRRDSDCGGSASIVCNQGRCGIKERSSASDDDDDRPSSSSSSSSTPKKKELKGLGEKCKFNGDCASKICGTLSSGSLHKCTNKR